MGQYVRRRTRSAAEPRLRRLSLGLSAWCAGRLGVVAPGRRGGLSDAHHHVDRRRGSGDRPASHEGRGCGFPAQTFAECLASGAIHSPRHRTPATAGAVARGQGSRRGSQQGQKRIPAQHEPRNPHAHERNYRHAGTGAEHASHAPASGVPEHRQAIRRFPASAAQ